MAEVRLASIDVNVDFKSPFHLLICQFCGRVALLRRKLREFQWRGEYHCSCCGNNLFLNTKFMKRPNEMFSPIELPSIFIEINFAGVRSS